MESWPPRDTSPEAARLLISLWRGMSPAAKLEQVRSITRGAWLLERAGVRLREPRLEEAQLDERVRVRRLEAIRANARR